MKQTRVQLVLEKLRMPYELRATRAWARCPYHDDHDPSWMIRVKGRRQGQHHCFACKVGGTLVELVMHVKHLDEDDARAWLKDFKEDEPTKVRARIIEKPPVLGRKRFKMPSEVIFDPLKEWVTLAQRYARKRGITDEQVSQYGLGYAVDARLAGRIVLPFRGIGGHPASYSARTFVDDEIRYLTPHAKEGADLGVLFGEHLWPPPWRRKVIVVTEGGIDGLAVDRVVPPSWSIGGLGGSEVQPIQITKLATFDIVIVLTDNDAAGHKAAKQLDIGLSRHTELRRVTLRRGFDAAKMKPEGLADALRTALDFDVA